MEGPGISWGLVIEPERTRSDDIVPLLQTLSYITAGSDTTETVNMLGGDICDNYYAAGFLMLLLKTIDNTDTNIFTNTFRIFHQ